MARDQKDKNHAFIFSSIYCYYFPLITPKTNNKILDSVLLWLHLKLFINREFNKKIGKQE